MLPYHNKITPKYKPAYTPAEPAVPKPAVFRVEHEEYEGECFRCPQPIVYLSHLVMDKIAALLKEYKTEWLAYLIGENYHVDDIYVPEQEVSTAKVDHVQYPVGVERIVGVIHSHPGFDTFHSGTDDEFLVGNHNISLVVSKADDINGKVRAETPCGKLLIQEATVERVKPDLTHFLSGTKERISNTWDKWRTKDIKDVKVKGGDKTVEQESQEFWDGYNGYGY